jgi:dolichyl-phosphate-mannose--protein O-mannosyl transferase
VSTLRDHIAWRGATIAAGLNTVGWMFNLMVARSAPDVPRWPALVSSSVGLLLLGYLVAGRARPRANVASALFLVNVMTIVAMLSVESAAYANYGARWAPFQAHKLGIITVGLLTPEIWVGLVSIAGYGGAALAQWWTFSPAVRAHLSLGEPWATVIFCVFGAALLIQSSRRYVIERQLLKSEHETASMTRLAQAFLAVRDLSNSPLQTIESATELACLRHPELAQELDPVQRALDRLRKLDELLARCEVQASTVQTSFDAESLLENP